MLLELRARNNQAAMLSGEDGPRSSAILREALELATRMGINQMTQWLTGTYVMSVVWDTPQWDEALAVLDAALDGPTSRADRARLLGIRMIIMVYRGEDIAATLAEWDELPESLSDPDIDAWSHLLPAVARLFGDRPQDAVPGIRAALAVSVQQATDARLALMRAAQWAGDIELAREALGLSEAAADLGRYMDAERALGRAGVAALEGRQGEALAAFRECIDVTRRWGCGLELALSQLCAIALLPDEDSIASSADEARAFFEQARMTPLLQRLDEAVAARVA
jgi:hypothetical protein